MGYVRQFARQGGIRERAGVYGIAKNVSRPVESGLGARVRDRGFAVRVGGEAVNARKIFEVI